LTDDEKGKTLDRDGTELAVLFHPEKSSWATDGHGFEQMNNGLHQFFAEPFG